MNGSFAATTTHWNNAAPKIVPLQQVVELAERGLVRRRLTVQVDAYGYINQVSLMTERGRWQPDRLLAARLEKPPIPNRPMVVAGPPTRRSWNRTLSVAPCRRQRAHSSHSGRLAHFSEADIDLVPFNPLPKAAMFI